MRWRNSAPDFLLLLYLFDYFLNIFMPKKLTGIEEVITCLIYSIVQF